MTPGGSPDDVETTTLRMASGLSRGERERERGGEQIRVRSRNKATVSYTPCQLHTFLHDYRNEGI